MNAPPRKTVDRRPSTVNAPKAHAGFDIVWTNHAAKRMVQRQFDPDEVMEAIAHLCASGALVPEKTVTITRGKMKVAAVRRDHWNGKPCNPPKLMIITVTFRRGGKFLPRHKRNSRRRR